MIEKKLYGFIIWMINYWFKCDLKNDCTILDSCILIQINVDKQLKASILNVAVQHGQTKINIS